MGDRPMPARVATNERSNALSEIPPERLPRHIAIIMDGNGRWANRHRLPRVEGHRRGAEVVRKVVEESSRLGLEQVTLYCLSSENWKRPPEELGFLMLLLRQFLIDERHTLQKNDLRLKVIGRRQPLPPEVQSEMDLTLGATAGNRGMCVCLAINYGGRAEILDAVRALADKVQRGTLRPGEIDETVFSGELYTAGMSDPDLVIRTAGEMRISNFLLWQISYAELWVTTRCWPDFEISDLHQALRDYAGRERRFGGLPS
jgi:undecaprenyl diphosphate synthase